MSERKFKVESFVLTLSIISTYNNLHSHFSSYSHGGDGNWRSLARGLTGGYSQVEVTVDSYLDKKSFSLIPDQPPSPFKASGQEGESAIDIDQLH